MACIIKISARKYFKQTCGEKVIIKPYIFCQRHYKSKIF